MVVNVKIWKDVNVAEGFRTTVRDGAYDLGSQTDFGISVSTEGSFNVDTDSWGDVYDSFHGEVQYDEYLEDDSVLIVIVNTTNLGAGQFWKYIGVNGTAGMCGVNAALVAAVNSPGCWNISDGDAALEATTIHEVAHTFGAWHDQGVVYNTTGDPVSPMMLWYADNNCWGTNTPVTSSCGSNDNRYSISTTITDSSSDCTEQVVEDHADDYNL